MDYRKFLARSEERVLPYTGGASVHAPDRRLRLQGEAQPGWWRFRVEGRHARPLTAAEPEGLQARPRVLGHWFESWLFVPGGKAEPVALLPEEQPAPFSPISARRWFSGELLFEGQEFEGDAEAPARLALEEGRTLAQLSGAPATLRTAFAFALLRARSRALGIPVSPGEVRRELAAIADQGAPAADAALRRLEAERRVYLQRSEAARERAQAAARPVTASGRDSEERATEALEAAGATVRSIRRLGGGNLEVVYVFMGERFISVVEARTLQVIDAGVCLAGEDSLVTLESLPSVLREAIAGDRLVITRGG